MGMSILVCVVCKSLDRERFSREQARARLFRMRTLLLSLIGCVEYERAFARGGKNERWLG
jgi:hypothetical protein